jgi:ATP-dependent protease ClpP protease subunit
MTKSNPKLTFKEAAIAVGVGLSLVVGAVGISEYARHKALKEVVQTQKKATPPLVFIAATEQFQIMRGSKDNSYIVHLTGGIEESTKYLILITFLTNLTKEDQVSFYIQGPGGYMDTTQLIYNAIHKNPAQIDMIVNGDVYSADALLALAGDSLQTKPNNLFLYHIPAIKYRGSNITMKAYCETILPTETDRGVSSKKKCEDFAKWYDKQAYLTTFKKVKDVLTPEQYQAMLDGDDVIIDGYTVIHALWKNNPIEELENGDLKINL